MHSYFTGGHVTKDELQSDNRADCMPNVAEC